VCCSAQATPCRANCRALATVSGVLSVVNLQREGLRDRRISGSPIPGTFFHAQNWDLKKMQVKEHIDE
jgi:hypothetical protein